MSKIEWESNIKRYEPNLRYRSSDDADLGMRTTELGDYVKYEDHKAIVAELKRNQKKINAAGVNDE